MIHNRTWYSRKIIWSLLIYISIFFNSHSQETSGDTFGEVQAKKSGTIVLSYLETPALAYKDAKGNVTGITVDILKEFAAFLEKKEGVKLTLQFKDNADYKSFYSSVKSGNGGIFGLGNTIISESKKKEVAFGPAYLANLPRLITHNSVETLKNIKSISSSFEYMKAYTTKGTMDEKRILEIKSGLYPKLTILNTSSGGEIIQKIVDDENAFAYVDVFYFMDAVKKNLPIKRHPVGDKPAEQYGIIMPLNSDWSAPLKEFFDADGGYTNSINYKKIVIKHVGASGAKLLEAAQASM